MSEIEKMKRYIERTNMNPEKVGLYRMSMLEAFELVKQPNGSVNLSIEMLSLAFNYGKAKGYRAAKAEVRK